MILLRDIARKTEEGRGIFLCVIFQFQGNYGTLENNKNERSPVYSERS